MTLENEQRCFSLRRRQKLRDDTSRGHGAAPRPADKSIIAKLDAN